MSGAGVGAGEAGSRGRGRAVPSHIAAMQLFHELKQQFPALPDHAVTACVTQHLHDPHHCHTHLQQASAPRDLPYPSALRHDNEQHPRKSSLTEEVVSACEQTDFSPISNKSRTTEIQTGSPKIPVLQTSPKPNPKKSSLAEETDFSHISNNPRVTLTRSPRLTSITNITCDEPKTSRIERRNPKSSVTEKAVSERTDFSPISNKPKATAISNTDIQSGNPKIPLHRSLKTDPRKSNLAGETVSERIDFSPISNKPKATEIQTGSPKILQRSPKIERKSSPKLDLRKEVLNSPSRKTSDSERTSVSSPSDISNKPIPSLRRSPKMESRKPNSKTDFRKSSLENLKSNSPEEATSSLPKIGSPLKPSFPEVSPKMERKSSLPEAILPKISPSVSGSERTPPLSPSDTRDFPPFTSKPPMSPSTSKKPPGRLTKPYDARILKLPEEGPSGAVRRAPAVRPDSLDLPKRTSDSAGSKTSPVQGVNLSVNVNCSVGVVESENGQARRHSAVLEVTPEPTWLHPPPYSPRSYTSVNLTLRTPTTPPQGPIDICSSPAPASLTYTTSSFDRRQGLQSRLQITVGPGPPVGSVTASRTRPTSCYQEQEQSRGGERAGSMPDLRAVKESTNHVVLLSRQKERKEQLRNELKAGKERLLSIKKEIEALKLENTPEYRTKLKKDIRHLQAQCERLTRDVDRHSESRVPLGETNEEFYRHIYTGQRPPSQRRRVPPSRGLHNPTTEDNEPRWPCHICTFRNHPLMDKCEQCEMPRVLLVSAGPGENIHIRFSPGNTTRVIHSWVV